MIGLLSRIFIKDSDDVTNPNVRRAYGMLGGIMGIVFNILLFLGKILAGVVSGSVAIVADAVNNLSDAGSSVITLAGFKAAGKKADKGHPFGHGRIEYVSGLVVSFLIAVMGIEMAKSSLEKIISPESVEASAATIVILTVSICVKLFMAYYNFSLAKKIDSATLKAAGTDSLSDSAATLLVLLSVIVMKTLGVNVDGWCGMLVAAFILYAGVSAIKETLNPLLGTAPDPKLVEQIREYVLSHDGISGIHDLLIHDYGPGRRMVSLHAEVSGDGDIYVLHDLIDHIEMELQEKLGCETVIHMDPIEANNETVMQMRSLVEKKIKEMDEELNIHDFRMVQGPTHTNLIFDVVVPQAYRLSDAEVESDIKKLVRKLDGNCYGVVKVEKSYL